MRLLLRGVVLKYNAIVGVCVGVGLELQGILFPCEKVSVLFHSELNSSGAFLKHVLL